MGRVGKRKVCVVLTRGELLGEEGIGQFHAFLGPFINFQGLVNQEIIQHFIAQLYYQSMILKMYYT